MKTVSGKVISSNPISLSKAASILSNFVSAETGASQAVCAYLRRASASFNELTQLHRELKYSSKSERKQRKTKSEITEEVIPSRSTEVVQKPSETERERRRHGAESGVQEKLTRGVELSQEPSDGVGDNLGVESGRKKHKKKKKEQAEFGYNEGQIGGAEIGIENEEKPIQGIELDLQLSQGVDGNLGVESERKKHKKMKKHGVDFGSFGDSGGEIGEANGAAIIGIEDEKGKKRKEENMDAFGNFGDNGFEEERQGGGQMGNEEGKREWRKKRKSREVEEGKVDGSKERQSKKKKRRKSEGDH